MLFLDPQFLIPFVPVILFSLTIHEFAHAWSAYKLGDPTAAATGRLTLNPLKHLDVMGTLVLFITGMFGWARPVPVNIFNFRDPKFGMFLSAAAGPASNILLALCCGILLRLTGLGAVAPESGFAGGLAVILFWGLVMNLALAFFNLIPIPPLDGSKIILGLAPHTWEEPLMKFQQIGPMFLFGLIAIGFLTPVSPIWLVIGPFVKVLAWLFAGIQIAF